MVAMYSCDISVKAEVLGRYGTCSRCFFITFSIGLIGTYILSEDNANRSIFLFGGETILAIYALQYRSSYDVYPH
jgi:hypothetical protein